MRINSVRLSTGHGENREHWRGDWREVISHCVVSPDPLTQSCLSGDSVLSGCPVVLLFIFLKYV